MAIKHPRTGVNGVTVWNATDDWNAAHTVEDDSIGEGHLIIVNAVTDGYVLAWSGADGKLKWVAQTGGGGGGNHVLLSATHTDTLVDSVLAGDLLFGNATPKWARLAKDTDGKFLKMVSGLPGWAAHGLSYSDVGAASTSDGRLSDARTPTAHQLDSATYHTVSGLTAGHFLKALTATTFGFAAHGLGYSDVGAAASGHTHAQLHDRSHDVESSSDHAASSKKGLFLKTNASTGAIEIVAHGLGYGDVGAEASGAVSSHSGLTTGVHGVGTGTVAKVADIATDANLSVAMQALKTTPPTHGSAQHDSTATLRFGWAGVTSFNLSTSATEYFIPVGRITASGSSDNILTQAMVPFAGTVRKLYIKLGTAPGVNGATKSRTFTLTLGGVAQSLTVTISATATTGSDTSNSFAVVAGNLISMKCEVANTPATGAVAWGFEIDPS